jgi:uncharacterized protein (TIGR02246 family)
MKLENKMKLSTLVKTGFAALLVCSVFSVQAQSVQDLADKWTVAYNSHDAEALGQVYSENAHLYLHSSPRIEGRENITEFWAGDMGDGNPITLLVVTNQVDGVDMVLVHGNYQVVDRDNGLQLGFGRFAHIWLLDDDGEWRLDRDLWNQPYTEAE